MSISMKSDKKSMHSEIERLRALIESYDGRLNMQAETIARCDATINNLISLLDAANVQVNDLTTQLQGRAQQTAARGDRATRMLITKRLAVSLKSTVRWNDERGFEYMNDGHWAVSPRHTLKFVMVGIQA